MQIISFPNSAFVSEGCFARMANSLPKAAESKGLAGPIRVSPFHRLLPRWNSRQLAAFCGP